MPWGRIDDGLYDHPKVDALPDGIRLACMGLTYLAISWSNRFLTDGFVPDERIRKLGGRTAHKTALIAVGLWDVAEGGALIHDFHAYNPTREAILAEREAARQRMQGVRQRSRNVRANIEPTEAERSPDVRAKFGRGSAAPSESRPVPSDSPLPPLGGGSVEGTPRANGTNPRALVAAQAAADAEMTKSKRWRHQQRELAYHRGAITEAELGEMQSRDAPLEEISDWLTHLASFETPDWLAER